MEEDQLPVWTALSVLKSLRADRTALDTTLGNRGSPRNRLAGTDRKSRSIHSNTRYGRSCGSSSGRTVSYRVRMEGQEAISEIP